MLLDEREVMPPPVDPPDDGGGGGGDDDGAGDDGSGDRIDWVTVASFNDAASAHVARLRVEAEGIACFIADENIGVVAWHYAIATGGIKLQVPREDAARAALALQRGRRAIPDAADDHLRICPRCGSSELEVDRFSPRRIIALMFLVIMLASTQPIVGALALVAGIVYVVASRRRVCIDCGAHWREPPARGFDVVSTRSPEKP